jgi:DNA adenine methylase
MGSKARFAKELLPIILKNRKPSQWYVEPFAGGMNMISEVTGNRIANDLHYYLIEMWKSLTSGWQPNEISKIEYYQVKENASNLPPHLVGWVGFNCSRFGKWFDGFAGTITTKEGNVRDYQRESRSAIAKQVPKMLGVVFENKSYEDLEIPPNSIIYCDPPYAGTRKYLDSIDHEFFWSWVRLLSNSGHTVFVSEYAAPEDFEVVWEKEVKSSISATSGSKGINHSTEKLFKYKGENK